MSSNPTIVARNLSKTYFLTKDGEERGFNLRRGRKVVEALKPISLVANSGESVGIIGRNGSGKSTLFSLLAGNETPTTGSVLVSSQPTLLSVSAALQPHLNAVDNVRLGLLAKGLRPAEVDEIKHDVAAWAEIGEAVDRPLKTYSSGMAARLKFAIATAVKPEILLVDEALATGDTAFNSKAQHRMESFLEHAATVLIVTHAIHTIRDHCTRALWLHEGTLIADGDPNVISQFYRRWTKFSAESDRKRAAQVIRRMRSEYVTPKIVLDSEAIDALDNS